MGKKKLEIKFVEDPLKRKVHFQNRMKGLLKKALELSVLSGTPLGVIAANIASHHGQGQEELNPQYPSSKFKAKEFSAELSPSVSVSVSEASAEGDLGLLENFLMRDDVEKAGRVGRMQNRTNAQLAASAPLHGDQNYFSTEWFHEQMSNDPSVSVSEATPEEDVGWLENFMMSCDEEEADTIPRMEYNHTNAQILAEADTVGRTGNHTNAQITAADTFPRMDITHTNAQLLAAAEAVPRMKYNYRNAQFAAAPRHGDQIDG